MSPTPSTPSTTVARPAGVTDERPRTDADFDDAVGRYRRELLAHCYRMTGSPTEAEDLVQETYLRAWRAFHSFEGRSSVRTWMYTIATNTCLDLLARRRPEPATGGEVRWLQPYPDSLLDELPAPGADEPESRALARETIELAYVVRARQAFRNVSCTASSASWNDPSIR